jgi:glycogen operon protein
MIEQGQPYPIGTTCDADGVNFSVWSGGAERIELCLFGHDGQQVQKHELPAKTDDVWHGYLPGCKAGQRYGYRAHGRYAPDEGLRFNSHKLLIDPYARELSGDFRWSPEVFDFIRDDGALRLNDADSAGCVPKSVVTGEAGKKMHKAPAISWAETIIYEANVRGYTMRHPGIAKNERGTFRGMKNRGILEYLKALGITTIELMPVHEFIDEAALTKQSLRNYWGYNPINFFAPAGRYANGNARHEFREMVNAIHDAGIEVLLDVVYNHTGETDCFGPSISFRGIDNLAYYRTVQGNPGEYINDTGCGNTINADHPAVREMIQDSLRYWATDMGVDGFRFDLATITARSENGFSAEHPLLQQIANDNTLRSLKLIAEPWDIGPGGYQLGNFPVGWAEWNDQYRDSVRRYWRGDARATAEVARRLHGSSDFFEKAGRSPAASINYVSAHDGFSLADVVSFEQRHNKANGENNKDGHSHNYSRNYGAEGETKDSGILSVRRKQRLNMLATLLLSQGTPMLLAGDEFGNSQQGNNNAYAQDNETGWLDWSGLAIDPEFRDQVSALIQLRQHTALIGQDRFLHAAEEIQWWHPDGRPMQPDDWLDCAAFALLLSTADDDTESAVRSVALLMNSSGNTVDFRLPADENGLNWQTVYTTSDSNLLEFENSQWQLNLEPRSLLVCTVSMDDRAA